MKLKFRTPRVSLGDIGWILLAGFLLFRISPQVKAAFGADAGDSVAPAFQLNTLDGEIVSLEHYRGSVVLVNFWATWCPPCRVEMPGFQAVYEDRSDEGFVVLGISTDRGGADEVREFLAERNITFPAAMATNQIVQDLGGVQALPTSFLIDREGRIRHEVKGIFAGPALRMAVDHLLEEPVTFGPTAGGAS